MGKGIYYGYIIRLKVIYTVQSTMFGSLQSKPTSTTAS